MNCVKLKVILLLDLPWQGLVSVLFVLCRQRVALPRRVARLYPAYGLYLYGEGLYAQETRALKLTGAPVLFLPGNAGSYKQGKSATLTEGW